MLLKAAEPLLLRLEARSKTNTNLLRGFLPPLCLILRAETEGDSREASSEGTSGTARKIRCAVLSPRFSAKEGRWKGKALVSTIRSKFSGTKCFERMQSALLRSDSPVSISWRWSQTRFDRNRAEAGTRVCPGMQEGTRREMRSDRGAEGCRGCAPLHAPLSAMEPASKPRAGKQMNRLRKAEVLRSSSRSPGCLFSISKRRA